MKYVAYAAAGLMAAALALPTTAQAEELKANYYVSPTHPIGVAYDTFGKILEEKSGGDLTIRTFSGGSLLGAKATVDGIKEDVADVGFVVMTYYPAQFPHGRILDDLAMVGDNAHAVAFAITELMMLRCEPCLKEFEAQEQLYLGTTSSPPYVLIGNGDLNSLQGLNGKKFRAAGSLWNRFTNYVKGVPVNIPSSDQYEGLDRGVIDATIYAVGGLKTHGLADVADTVVMLPLGTFRNSNMFAFNQARWQELTTEQRQAVLEAASAGTVEATYAYHEGDDEGIALAEEEGIELQEPAQELLDTIDAFVEQDVKDTIERAKTEYGLPDAEEFVNTYRELYAKYEPMVEEIGDDKEKMTQLMWDEIFSKVDPDTYFMN